MFGQKNENNKLKYSQLLEGDRIESRLPLKIFFTLLQPNLVFMVDFNSLAGNAKNFFSTFDNSFHIYLLDVRISKIWMKFRSHNGFLKADVDRAKNCNRIGQIGCSIWLVAQKAIHCNLHLGTFWSLQKLSLNRMTLATSLSIQQFRWLSNSSRVRRLQNSYEIVQEFWSEFLNSF